MRKAEVEAIYLAVRRLLDAFAGVDGRHFLVVEFERRGD